MSSPLGDEKFPSPEHSEPNAKSNVPLPWKTCIRWLPVSATAITPSSMVFEFPLTATSSGDEKFPPLEPSEPNLKSRVPF